MSDTPTDFGVVSRLDADAVGSPGQRTFRLVVTSREGTATLWLEKEELQALGVAINQLMAQLSGRPEWKRYGSEPEPYKPGGEVSPDPLVEFKIGQLSLGYEADTSMFVLLAHDSEGDPEGPPTFTCQASSRQLRALSRRIESVLSAGRPRCPLCGDPMEPEGHVCVRAN